MRKLTLAYDREKFWRSYWLEHGVDHGQFVDLGMYPIVQTLPHLKAEDKILECGCGAGRVVRHLHGAGFDITGLEYDGEILRKLKTAAPELNLVEGDATALPFPDASFDVVLCFGVVGTLEQGIDTAIAEIHRVLRPGGVAIISVMLDNVARRAQKLLNAIGASGVSQFYAWIDTESGWRRFFEYSRFDVIGVSPMVSRYNLFYWTPALRSGESVDLTAARVSDRLYRLNWMGQALWLLHKTWLRRSFAAATVFALRKSH
jgi:SAM-dependent methyltransferase